MNDIDPVKICCGNRQSAHVGALCPTGMVMCCCCFAAFFPHQLKTLDDGTRENVCLNCAAHEAFMIELCDWIAAVSEET